MRHHSPFARATEPYQCALAFGVLSNVWLSQPMSPKVGANPLAHS